MKKRLAVAAAALMFAGLGAGVVGATPGPNGNNDHGLCTAYFNGQKKGHDKNGNPGPFEALVGEQSLQEVFDHCNSEVPKGIGGNPDENGRFTECFTDDGDPNTPTCEDG